METLDGGFDYDEALRRLLAHEGGYTNHPSEPGGPTNFGITLADYRRYIKPDGAVADVRALSVDQARQSCGSRLSATTPRTDSIMVSDAKSMSVSDMLAHRNQ